MLMIDDPKAAEMAQRAHEYEQSVLAYEALNQQVDALLNASGGHRSNLSSEALSHYRILAARRDDAYNTMKTLERALLDE
jgi:tRNA A37 threonylcarbamoyltransferase TsaD